MLPDEPNEEERLQELAEDNGTPFQPADPASADDDLDTTHPVTDTNVDPQELYDEGVSGAAEATEPNAGNDVVGYEKPEQPEGLS